ncbi:MAG: SPOR domain-containing protein [Calditrichaeota bacterium]|nr:MAG: SPOR domain-containing protein [Calditrichota bacterium]
MNGLKIITTIFLFSVLVYLSGCSSSKPVTVPGGESAEPTLNETFDPLMLEDEDITFPEEVEIPSTGNSEIVPGLDTQPAPVEENQVVDGFRVQILATKDIDQATMEKKQAEFQFLEDSVAVYIEFDSPMYKVRVGDFQNRDEAERLRQIARKKGYRGAWIVKTKVNTHPKLPVINESEMEDLAPR